MDKVRWIEIGQYMIKVKNIVYIEKTESRGGPAIEVNLNDEGGTIIRIPYANPDVRDDAFINLRYDLMNT